MCFVADNKIPPTIWRAQLLLYVLVAGKLVQPGNDEIRFREPIPGSRSLKFVIGQDLEWQMETTIELILPLLREASWADDKTALEITSCDELFHEQPRHDRLACAWIVSQKKP
jgi:hypothetical protein